MATKNNHNSDLRTRFCEMLVSLCNRPKLYTFDGGFKEIVVYIEGFVHGNGFPKGEINLEGGMEPFGRWLAAQSGRNQRRKWHEILVERFNDNEVQAVQQLSAVYQDYLDKTSGNQTC
jgi:hypothetical protein